MVPAAGWRALGAGPRAGRVVRPGLRGRCAPGAGGRQPADRTGPAAEPHADDAGSAAAGDAARRQVRKKTKASGILHDGMPIRHWDTEVGDTSPRLFVLDAAGVAGGAGVRCDGAERGELQDLAPAARFELADAQTSLSTDGSRVLSTWTRRAVRGRPRTEVVELNDDGVPRVLCSEPDADFYAPILSPDGSAYAVLREEWASFDTPPTTSLQIRRADTVVDAALGDLEAGELVWAPDGSVLYVSGDHHGAGAVLAVDPDTGRVLRRLASDAAYSQLCPAPDGRSLYAVRSTVDRPPHPVRLAVGAVDQDPAILSAPGALADRPGRLARVEAAVDGVTVTGWLCLPETADGPRPLLTWVHGGPFGSWNAWSWRWCPWVAVARGYAVLLPDPALSTGYGPEWITRAWPYRAAVLWRDVEGLLDHVLADPALGLDPTRTAVLGGSFGGFMTNWIAGRTERFRAVVTHAGLWALDQQHGTTDAAAYKTGIFGRLADHPEWYAENSPERRLDDIRTPVLLVHGNRDYRVPVSEALRMWWDLVSTWTGPPAELPHRFLQFTEENHWVLNPTNAITWYDTVLDFCDRHLR